MARTSTVKFLDELSFKAKRYSGDGQYKRIQITGTGSSDFVEEVGSVTSRVGDNAIIVPVTPVTRATTIVFGNATFAFTVGTPIGMGQRAVGDTVDDLTVDSASCATFATGDQLVFDILVDYEEMSETEVELEYIDSKSGSTPEFSRPIKEKGVIRHRKRNLDPERTLSIAQKYQSRTEGLMNLAGQEYVLKVTRMDDNFLVATESDFYYQCYHNAPEISGSTGAQDSTVSFDVTYERRASIAE